MVRYCIGLKIRAKFSANLQALLIDSQLGLAVMTSSKDTGKKYTEKSPYEYAVSLLQFELRLFWQRALFFWGFIASAFWGLINTIDTDPFLTVVIIIFGLVCSFCWSIVNRGSKYWYEHWENRVIENEQECIGRKLYKDDKNKSVQTGYWVQHWSVSKALIFLSDAVFVLWVIILGYFVLCNPYFV